MQLKARSSRPAALRAFEVIVFDFDGVVIDSADDLVDAVQHSLHAVGSKDPGYWAIRRQIGIGARQLLLQSMDVEKRHRIDNAMEVFREYYTQNCVNHTVLYPGVEEMLALCHQSKYVALATFKIRTATERILTSLNVMQHFDVIVTADDVVRPKPDPESIQTILNNLHCEADATLLVGDTPTDIQTGRNAGTAICAVTYGMGTRDCLQDDRPDFLIDDIRELREILTV